MRHFKTSMFALLAAAGLLVTGCTCKPSPSPSPSPQNSPDLAVAAAVPEQVPAPMVLVGKWRLEAKSEDSSRVTVYKFLKDGRVETDVRIVSPRFKGGNVIKAVITNVDGDKITWVNVSVVGEAGGEEFFKPGSQQPVTRQFRVAGDELHLVLIGDKMNETPKPAVLTRVKE